MTWVAGADGCPAGWATVFWQGPNGTPPRLRVLPNMTALLEAEEAPSVIAVDMPIGLAERAERGGRPCERETRKRLGARQSSVFATPARLALAAQTYEDACRLNRTESDPPLGVSKQCFNIFPKIREIDALMTPELQTRLRECHPELSFWAMNGETPLPLPKKVKSTPHAPGLELRRTLLRKVGFPLDDLEMPAIKLKDAAPDDILDACACAWSAWRMREGKELRLPEEPQVNAAGLRMEISA